MPDQSELQTYARLLRLTPVAEVTVPARAAESGDWFAERRARRRSMLRVFFALVVVPTALVTAYFGLFAADRFVSEASFVIRAPSQSLPTALSTLLDSAGLGRTANDSYAVRDYVLSRDAVASLDGDETLRKAYRNRNADPVWRFPNFYTPDNREGLFRHYLRLITVSYDPTSAVSTIRVEAFDAADARLLVSRLLEAAERLVNRLNERARRDTVALAEQEAARMQRRVVQAQAALTAFRNREAMIDPSQYTLAVLDTITQLSIEAAQLNIKLTEIERAAPEGPQIAPMRTRRNAIEQQIALERRRLAGQADSVSTKIAEYESLALEREFSERAFKTALDAFEAARVDAQRKAVYLERIAGPNLPDHPVYPYRFLWCILTFTIGLIVFRVVTILLADTRRHASS